MVITICHLPCVYFEHVLKCLTGAFDELVLCVPTMMFRRMSTSLLIASQMLILAAILDPRSRGQVGLPMFPDPISFGGSCLEIVSLPYQKHPLQPFDEGRVDVRSIRILPRRECSSEDCNIATTRTSISVGVISINMTTESCSKA